MQGVFIRVAAVVAFAVGLSACATPAIDTSTPSHIAVIEVESQPGLQAPYLIERLKAELPRVAQSYDKTRAPKKLKIVVQNVSYLTSGKALLGLKSEVYAEVTVEDVATKKQDVNFVMYAPDTDGAVGNIGRIMRATSIDDRKHDDAMATVFAKKVFFKIYAR